MEKKRVRIRIEGRVQGVYFRAYTRDEAVRLGLSGWVRNLPDSSVEVVVEGAPEQVERMVAWCHRGSPMSRVDRVLVTEEELTGEEGFVIRY